LSTRCASASRAACSTRSAGSTRATASITASTATCRWPSSTAVERCLIVNAPFRHHGGKTRTRGFDDDPGLERADLTKRDSALSRFADKYRHRLPCDVRSPAERVRDWFKARPA
jgi:hypothetical protein